jgi:hypothetical protein
VASSPDLPRGWDPRSDSLEDLVRTLFDEDELRRDAAEGAPRTERNESVDPPQPPSAAPTELGPKPGQPRPADLGPRPGTSRPTGGTVHPRFYPLAVAALATATLLVGGAAGWQIHAARAPAAGVATDAAVSTRAAAPATAALSPPVSPAPTATTAALTAAVAPAPVAIPFGTRSDVGEGWRLAATRPYLCDVLMAIPALQQDGTRIIRVTLTLTNRTGTTQPTRAWELAAAADGEPAELVLWPAERFRGVPDVMLTPGRSVRFLVAVRVPQERTRVEITARRADTLRAVLGGSL